MSRPDSYPTGGGSIGAYRRKRQWIKECGPDTSGLREQQAGLHRKYLFAAAVHIATRVGTYRDGQPLTLEAHDYAVEQVGRLYLESLKPEEQAEYLRTHFGINLSDPSAGLVPENVRAIDGYSSDRDYAEYMDPKVVVASIQSMVGEVEVSRQSGREANSA